VFERFAERARQVVVFAQDEARFRELYEGRQPLYEEVADGRAHDADDVVLAAGGVTVSAMPRDLVPGIGPAELVADERVLELHPPPVDARVLTVPPGEEAKTVATAERLWRELRLDRGGTLVAFGGGCTTDVAGFVAATYLRGIDWIAVPTTLVGQVDAAIGGKTAIDLPEGKNLVGAFHWPVRTVIDPALLETLPEEQRREGLAEVVKTGLLAGERLWELPDADLVRRCAVFKTALCLRDPYDDGPRQALNLGHTFAHALEAAAGYETVTHGRAVALGLLAALRLSGRPTDAVEAVRCGLRIALPRASDPAAPPTRTAGHPSTRASGGTSVFASIATPTNVAAAPMPIASSRSVVEIPLMKRPMSMSAAAPCCSIWPRRATCCWKTSRPVSWTGSASAGKCCTKSTRA